MVTHKNKAARNIAANVTGLRRRIGISQAQLAELAGITRASIALVESGSSNPGLEILVKLSACLKISIDELISAPKADCVLLRSADIPLDRRSKNGVRLKRLLPDKLPATELDELTLEPGAVLTGSPHIEGTREYFTCIRGNIKIAVLGEVYLLSKGDVLSFPGDKPHSYKNEGSLQAQGVSVVFFSP